MDRIRAIVNWVLGGEPVEFDPYSDPGEFESKGDHSNEH